MINQNEIKKWYDVEYCKNPKRFTRDIRGYMPFIKYLSPISGKRILDIACGTGVFLKLCEGKGLETFGVDISNEAVELAKKNIPQGKITVANGENLPFEDKMFDYVSNIGSLEHYIDQKKGIKEMIRVLKDNGKIMIVLPNSFWELNKGTGQKLERLNTLHNWEKLLKDNGLNIIMICKDFGPNIFHDLKPFKIFLRTMGKLITMIMPISFAYQFVFICHPKEWKEQ